jgi:group I intron endonuclease
MISTIYKATNTINGKAYIGFDSNWPKRKRTHKSKHKYADSNFYSALRKYGWGAFTWEILYQSKDKNYCLNFAERHFIKFYDTLRYGYNMTEGGDGCFGATTNKYWVNNGTTTKRVTEIPIGWKKGRLHYIRKGGMSQESKNLISIKNKGKLIGEKNPAAKQVTIKDKTFVTIKEAARYYKTTAYLLKKNYL